VGELQTILSRELDPITPGVVSITTIYGGNAFNVIPQEVRLQGTICSLTTAGLGFLQERVRTIAEGTAAAHRCSAQVDFPGEDYPATVNDAASWALARQLGAGLLGDAAVRELTSIMGGENFFRLLAISCG
jgi:IAA-amino acid hydrolase